MPARSPFVIAFGSFDAWVEGHVLPNIESGKLEARDMFEIVAALRSWESSGVWDRAFAQADKRGH